MDISEKNLFQKFDTNTIRFFSKRKYSCIKTQLFFFNLKVNRIFDVTLRKHKLKLHNLKSIYQHKAKQNDLIHRKCYPKHYITYYTSKLTTIRHVFKILITY